MPWCGRPAGPPRALHRRRHRSADSISADPSTSANWNKDGMSLRGIVEAMGYARCFAVAP